jgi:hypothetical protein
MMNYDEAKLAFTSLFNHEMSDESMREFLVGISLDENTSVSRASPWKQKTRKGLF